MEKPDTGLISQGTGKAPRIFAAINAVMLKVGAIAKTGLNKFQNYNFRGIDDVYNSLNAPMAAEGIFSTSEILESKFEVGATKSGTVQQHVWLRMKYTFWAADGSSVSTETVGEAEDTSDKASNKAMAVAHKYALLQIFAIPTVDPKDPEVDSPAVFQNRKPAQAAPLPPRAAGAYPNNDPALAPGAPKPKDDGPAVKTNGVNAEDFLRDAESAYEACATSAEVKSLYERLKADSRLAKMPDKSAIIGSIWSMANTRKNSLGGK